MRGARDEKCDELALTPGRRRIGSRPMSAQLRRQPARNMCRWTAAWIRSLFSAARYSPVRYSTYSPLRSRMTAAGREDTSSRGRLCSSRRAARWGLRCSTRSARVTGADKASKAGPAMPSSRCWAMWTGKYSSWLLTGGSTATQTHTDPSSRQGGPAGGPAVAAAAQPCQCRGVGSCGEDGQDNGNEFKHHSVSRIGPSGRSRTGRPCAAAHEHDADDDHNHGEDVPGQVVGPDGHVVTDLMQSQELALDGAVIKLKAPRSQQQRAPRAFGDEAPGEASRPSRTARPPAR